MKVTTFGEDMIPDIPENLEGPEVVAVPEAVGEARSRRRFAVRDRRQKLNVPRCPSQREREEHMLTHQPPED